MIIHTGTRRSGKTTKAILLANSTKALMIVHSEEMAKYIRRQSEEMGYPVEVMGVQHYLNHRQGFRDQKLVIDEMDMVLRQVFRADVIMGTTTGVSINNLDLEYEERIEDKWLR